MDETYCVFCGMCFGVFAQLYHGRLDNKDIDWTDFFIARLWWRLFDFLPR